MYKSYPRWITCTATRIYRPDAEHTTTLASSQTRGLAAGFGDPHHHRPLGQSMAQYQLHYWLGARMFRSLSESAERWRVERLFLPERAATNEQDDSDIRHMDKLMRLTNVKGSYFSSPTRTSIGKIFPPSLYLQFFVGTSQQLFIDKWAATYNVSVLICTNQIISFAWLFMHAQ
jgi:hypothetical protein